jgi:hypothetical protein
MAMGADRAESAHNLRIIVALPQGDGGRRTRTRTVDPLIKSQLLYQLSYAPPSAGKYGRDAVRQARPVGPAALR